MKKLIFLIPVFFLISAIGKFAGKSAREYHNPQPAPHVTAAPAKTGLQIWWEAKAQNEKEVTEIAEHKKKFAGFKPAPLQTAQTTTDHFYNFATLTAQGYRLSREVENSGFSKESCDALISAYKVYFTDGNRQTNPQFDPLLNKLLSDIKNTTRIIR